MAFESIIISDIHLGSELCQANHLINFLNKIKHSEINTELLILNGDVFDSHDFRRLKKSHWKILSIIRKISRHIRVIWVAGNHDGPIDVLSHLLGVEVYKEFYLSSKDKRILITHGDKFDEIMSKHPMLSKIADKMYRWITRWFPNRFSRLIKKTSKTYSRAIETVKYKSVEEAIKRKFNVVICGHTHHPEIDQSKKAIYANSGSWTENPTYLSVKNGVIDLHIFL